MMTVVRILVLIYMVVVVKMAEIGKFMLKMLVLMMTFGVVMVPLVIEGNDVLTGVVDLRFRTSSIRQYFF